MLNVSPVVLRLWQREIAEAAMYYAELRARLNSAGPEAPTTDTSASTCDSSAPDSSG